MRARRGKKSTQDAMSTRNVRARRDSNLGACAHACVRRQLFPVLDFLISTCKVKEKGRRKTLSKDYSDELPIRTLSSHENERICLLSS